MNLEIRKLGDWQKIRRKSFLYHAHVLMLMQSQIILLKFSSLVRRPLGKDRRTVTVLYFTKHLISIKYGRDEQFRKHTEVDLKKYYAYKKRV